MSGDVCDCCLRPEQVVLGVASSGLGAISFAFCRECLDHVCEPEFMLEYMWMMCDGDPSKLHESMSDFTCFKDGVYVSWPDWCTWRLTQGPIRYPEWEETEVEDEEFPDFGGDAS